MGSYKTKTCTGCNVEKTIDNFYGDARVAGGVKARCKRCVNDYYYNKNRELQITKMCDWVRNNGG